MAIAFRHITSSNNTTDAASFNTSNVGANPNELILGWTIADRNGVSPASVPTLSGGGIAAWDLIVSRLYDSNTITLCVFRALEASPGAAAPVTIDLGGVTHAVCAWGFSGYTGCDLSGSNGAGAIVQFREGFGSTTVPTLTFSTPTTAGNAVAGACGRVAVGTVPGVPTAWTSAFSSVMSAPASAVRGAYNLTNDDTSDWNLTTPNNYAIVQVEIKVAEIVGNFIGSDDPHMLAPYRDEGRVVTIWG